MSGSLTSIVTIVKDGEEFLAEAIDSVRNQTSDRWELHLVDDGSIDGTLDLIHDAVRTDPDRVFAHRHPNGENRGMSASRNLGLRHSRGDAVTWLDHDDAMLPRKIEAMRSALDRYAEAVAIVAPVRRWYSWTGDGEDRRPDVDQVFPDPFDRLLLPPSIVPTFIADRQLVPLSPMVRRAPLLAMGGHVESFTGMHEDQAFLARLFFRHPIVLIDEVLHLYRQHEESCVANTYRLGRERDARRTFLRWLEMENATAGPRTLEFRSLLRRQFALTRGGWYRRLRRALINLRNRDAAP